MILSIPIAWLQLIHKRVRFLATLAGLAFIVILLFMQLGFQDALYASATQVHNNLRGDLFVISPQYISLTSQQSFPRARLYQTLGYEGVDSVTPLYHEFGKTKSIDTGQKNPIFVFGIGLDSVTFDLPEINQNLDQLRIPDQALFDRNSRPEFGPVAEKAQQEEVEIEVSYFNDLTLASRLKIAGLFTLGASFGVDGNLIVSQSTFLNIFDYRKADFIDIGLIKLKPGADIKKVQTILKANLPKDVRILDRKEFSEVEKSYWNIRTPIGFAFQLMVTMGFVIGVVVVYQVLYSNISSHLVEYATLKAMGHTQNYLLSVVFQQAVILAVLGYIPGFALSLGLYDLAEAGTHLPFFMHLHQALVVLFSTVFMCSISGFLAMNKLRSVDPADIF
ncbi:MAG: FtsX-like permease family protein [Symploca sp. SIO3C6]|uniref:FtsX-like permease family protein n=1 Tax=Symploca sp. SIO1C4 TaxID=2607765 RepID=A0A6B3N6K0_9CYAN|nr:FtsX-like permease family protein [Symploca sp. SIO3C6]NER28739.1 FtsX-like permease family protein [Symploca sp. SIO1C4]NET06418.1 FtsX-like permease family protein [Symploca sp. SIO2B6]